MRQLVDVNSDGIISDEELREHMKGHGYSDEPEGLIARVFSGIDFDSSGEIEKAELPVDTAVLGGRQRAATPPPPPRAVPAYRLLSTLRRSPGAT